MWGLVYNTFIMQPWSPVPNLKFDVNQEFSLYWKHLAWSFDSAYI